MQVHAATVQVMTERPRINGDVLVRAVAGEGQMNDGRPVAGFNVRRRYHGDTFYIQKATEFSAKWMEFVGQAPEDWVPIIKNRYPEWNGESRFEQEQREAASEPRTMLEAGNPTKIESGQFDYSNGGPRKKRNKLNLG